ncbi:hypothetical protein ABR759_09135 [Escherichia coli]
MQALRELCDTHGILLVADEVQTGFCPYWQAICDAALRCESRSDNNGEKVWLAASRYRGLWGVPKSWMPRLREDWEVLMPVIRWQ